MDNIDGSCCKAKKNKVKKLEHIVYKSTMLLVCSVRKSIPLF